MWSDAGQLLHWSEAGCWYDSSCEGMQRHWLTNLNWSASMASALRLVQWFTDMVWAKQPGSRMSRGSSRGSCFFADLHCFDHVCACF
jgi:hypothetical protein